MKHLILLLALCSIAHAQIMPGARRAASVLPVAVGGCTTPDNGDELDEGFVGSGYENAAAWSEVTTAGTVNEDVTLSGSPPVNSCTEGLAIAATGGVAYAVWDRGTSFDRTSGALDITVEFYVDSCSIDNYSYVTLFAWYNSALTGYTARVQIYHSTSGTLAVRGEGASNSTTAALSTDTWHTLVLHIENGADSAYITLNGGSELSFTIIATDGQKLVVGPIAGLANAENVDLEYGYVSINSP